MPDIGQTAQDRDLRLIPLALESPEPTSRPPGSQAWCPEYMWERSSPLLAVGFDDEAARSVLYETERMTGGTCMVTMEHVILNWADNVIKDGVLHTKFQNNTELYALGISRENVRHGWRVGTGLHPYRDGVAIDARKLKPDVMLRGPVMLATADEPGNWGLFLLQCLPAALRYVKDRKRYGKFLCHAPQGNRRDLLRLVGIRDEDFVHHDVSLTYGLEEVRFFQTGFRDLVVSSEDRALFLGLAEHIRWNHKVRNAPRLFLSRRMRTAEHGVYRTLRNELELRHALEKSGFESIETEYMGPVDQIRTMAGAQTIVGLGGAGMFNLVFCPAEARVLDIESTSKFTNAHTNIFASCGLDYGVHIGMEIPDASRADHHDWEVDVQQVLRSLDILMSYNRSAHSPVVCRVDRMDRGRVSGWAHNPAEPGAKLRLNVFVDGKQVSVFVDNAKVEHVTCSQSRPDVLAAGMGPEACGYSFSLPKSALDGLHHVLEFRTLDGRALRLRCGDGDFDQRMFGHLWQPRLLSSVEYVEGGLIRGWVLAAEFETGLFVGKQRVALTWNGRRLGSTVADGLLNEGLDDQAVGMKCAFSFELPSWLLLESKPLLRIFVEPQHAELEGSPLKPIAQGDEQRRAALSLYDTLTRLQEEVIASSGIVRNIALARYPRAGFARWDSEVSALLAERIPTLALARASSLRSERLLVFVVVRDSDIALVQLTLASIAAQTTPGTSVCLVLTAEPAMQQVLADTAGQYAPLAWTVLDRRGRSIDWTDLAMLPPAAGQDWCMFLESGDTLRPYAWSVLQAAAVDSRIELLYFDDVDGRGNPRLKPGWNRTLLQLGDIVGRSVAVRAEAAVRTPRRAAGSGEHPVERMLAALADIGIRHVPAVLASVAVDRPQPAAEARSDEYPMVWEAEEVARQIALARTVDVSILFVDEWDPGEFRRCADLLVSQVDYPTYEIVACCSDLHFAEIGNQPLALPKGVRLRHVSMDGLLDVAGRLSECMDKVRTEFVIVISGHVLRPKPQWLRGLMRECLDKPTVGAVGGKNLDADGTLRDAGFVKTADGGLAAVGEGQAARAPGYLDRFARSQEVSALAGPAVLFRREALLGVAHMGSGQGSVAAMMPEACLGLPALGYKVVWTPEAVATCLDLAQPATPEMFRSRLPSGRLGSRASDPFYNPNFSAEQPLFSQLETPVNAAGQLMLLLALP